MNIHWRTTAIRIGYIFALCLAVVATMATLLLLKSKEFVYTQALVPIASTSTPFPVSVNVLAKEIVEDPTFDTFYTNTLAQHIESETSWWNQVAATLMTRGWYQNLASPVSRVIVIWPGERKEEVAKNIGEVLRWNASERAAFIALMTDTPPSLGEGTYFPGQYTAHRGATPTNIVTMLQDDYQHEVLDRYTPEVSAKVPLDETLIIASLIEREANTFTNMREVSGVIWNRLFINMPLQLDATLQYARGSNPNEAAWWPKVLPRDKYIDSTFNTYQNTGLPPAPIANPSVEAIVAALNPVATDCLYYFHTDAGEYVCSTSYEDHVSALKARYGRGL